MQFFLRLFFCFSLFFPQATYTQTTDSLAKRIDANAKSIEQSAQAIQRWKDSLEKEKIYRNLAQHGQPLDEFLQERREAEEKRKRQLYLRIGLGILFLLFVIAELVRRRKR
jgi:uncharacterized membrane protein YcjF (UPF0283 family)